MSRGAVYKLIFIICLTAFAVVLILPTVGEREMVITFKDDVTSAQIETVGGMFPRERYHSVKNDENLTVRGYGLNDAVMNHVRSMPGVRDSKFIPHWAEGRPIRAKRINLGLDLQGGMQLVLLPNFDLLQKRIGRQLSENDKTEVSQQALELLRNRVDQFGVSEPQLRRRESGAIEIQLPGVRDPEAVKRLIGTTGRVEYRLVDDTWSGKAEEWLRGNAEIKEKGLPLEPADQRNLLAKISEDIHLPDSFELLFMFERNPNTKKLFPSRPMALEKKLSLAGDDIQKAYRAYDEYGRVVVSFSTTTPGSAKFAEATSQKNHGKKLAIIIDNKVRSAPSINVHITTGNAQITGDFTDEEVNTLISIIKEGALPVDLERAEERSVGPSLGVDSINSGVKAMEVAALVVILFMVVYYKMAGVISSLGVCLHLTFMLAVLSWLNFTLTLPGIAGFVLNIGMGVDANIIIYERIKEELHGGKSPRMAITAGFDKAFWTIVDSNITALIAAFILTQFGTGPIKGFAVTLALGIIVNMFVVLYVTKFVYELIAARKNLKKISI